jgi:hypothetical protein
MYIIEIDLRLLCKSESKVWVKSHHTKKGPVRGHYKKVKSGAEKPDKIDYTDILSPLSEDFLLGKDIEFDPKIKDAVKHISFEDKEDVKNLHAGLDSLYSNDSEYFKFNGYSKDEWLQTSNGLGAGLLKYFMTKIYGESEIQHHDYVSIVNMEEYIKDSLSDLSNKIDIGMDSNNIIDYIKLQKDLTKQLLDIRFPDQDEFTVYRGTTSREVGGSEVRSGDKVDIAQNSISSWTLRSDIAENFAGKENGIVLKMVVSKEDIWSSFLTHSYSTYEQEMIVIGKKGRIGEVVKVSEA